MTPSQQHREAAIGLLRGIVDDEEAKDADRRAAAADLIRVLGEEGDATAQRRAMEMSDDELLAVVIDARERREKGPEQGTPIAGTPVVGPTDWDSVPGGTMDGGFAAALAGIADTEPDPQFLAS